MLVLNHRGSSFLYIIVCVVMSEKIYLCVCSGGKLLLYMSLLEYLSGLSYWVVAFGCVSLGDPTSSSFKKEEGCVCVCVLSLCMCV